jgi:DNA-binding PadR family transcriptional regulator
LIEEINAANEKDAGEDRRRVYRLSPAGRKLARNEADRLADLLRVARARNILRGDYV